MKKIFCFLLATILLCNSVGAASATSTEHADATISPELISIAYMALNEVDTNMQSAILAARDEVIHSHTITF